MTADAERELLTAGAGEIGVSLSPAQVDALLRLVDELERANSQFNLTAIRDRPGMLTKHVLDSLSLHAYLRGTRVADIGTGAGFPGLPLAVVNPARRFALIEAPGKKARFAAQAALRQRRGGAYAGGKLPAVRAVRYGDRARPVLAAGLRSVRRPPVRSAGPVIGDEGQAPG